MFDALESGKMKAVWIACTNPLVSLPNLNRIEKAMKNAKFVVVQDISHKSDTVAFGDLVLPAAAWLEKEGTMTNSERRISYLPKEIEAPGEARPDVEIFCDFAQRMGFRGFNFNSASEIYDEYVSGQCRRIGIKVHRDCLAIKSFIHHQERHSLTIQALFKIHQYQPITIFL